MKQQKTLVQAWLLRIANPQIIKRLGHFLTPDFKSGGTPNGRLDKIRDTSFILNMQENKRKVSKKKLSGN